VRVKAAEAHLFWPLVLLAFVAMAVAAISGLTLIAEFDEASVVREQMVVANGLRGKVGEVAHLTVTELDWDEAVRNLDNRFDPSWALHNIGEYFWQNDRFAASFILRPDGMPEFAALRGEIAPPGAYTAYAPEAAPLIATLRDAEARRGALAGKSAKALSEAPPILASTLARIGDSICILTATLVQPDFGTALPKGSRAPVVINAMAIDADFLHSLAARFLLQDLELHPGPFHAEPAAAGIALSTSRGESVAKLVWAPERPGSALLKKNGLPMLGVLSLLAAGILLLYRRAKGIAGKLVTSEARAAHLAYHDALTGLPNRILFHDRLSHALSRMRRAHDVLAVYCIDLDRFKLINDTFGHHVGDELIKRVGRMMQAQCRTSDTIARMSGDEFAIIQSDASVAAAAMLAGRLTELLREPIELDVGRVFIGCTIGIAIVSDPGPQPADILRQADMALYRAKEHAKGTFCFFEPEMDSAIKTRRALEADLRTALAEGGLYLAYQPQINERTGITGVEALLRWTHPERGELSPAFFVGIAEECGLIIDLGMFALRRAFEDSKRWKHLKVAINISPKQLRMKDFAAKVVDLAREVGVEPRQFELEITEGFLLDDDPETHLVLNRLREAGFDLALDDFGTGYSSLSYLHRYPINRIKIDRSFVANLGNAEEAEEFITAIVRLARALKLSVIAEGVETPSQHSCLSEAGCPDMQGYLFGRPVCADEIDRLAARALT
jgi:diguanylate cyclase (GGDEF)-like protein